MLSNELWNYFYLGLQSTLARFVGKVRFLVPLRALVFALYEHERPSAGSLTFAVADRRAPAASAAPCYHSTIVAPEKPRSATH